MVLGKDEINLRYCPVVGHNVVVEFTRGQRTGSKDAKPSCHCAQQCEKERGGCTNTVFSCKG